MSERLVVHNAVVFTPMPSEDRLWQTVVYAPGFLVVEDGLVRAVGRQESEAVERRWQPATVLDAGGRLVTPGFVDCHTHPVFFNHRAHEFEMRVHGTSYVEIARAGGGIRYSVRDLRQASLDELVERLLPRLDSFLAHGTTTVEAKSGYGLSLEDELKSLEAIRRADAMHPVDLVPTFLGAHEIPDEYRNRRKAYIDLLIEEMIPQVAERGLARFIDVFCESHVYTADEAMAILRAGAEYGLVPKIHADQLTWSGGARVAAEVGAASADHLEHTPPEMDGVLLEAGVIPVMLPGADFFLNSETYGPARRMIDTGLPVALATDFNPGSCMCENMQLMLTLAALKLRMTPAESFVAATLHAARAIRQERLGALVEGWQADFVIWQAASVTEIAYHYGINHVFQVYKKGKRVYENNYVVQRTGGQ